MRHTKDELIGLFKDLVDSESMLVSEEQQRPFEADGLLSFSQIPQLTLLPQNKQQVQQIIKVAAMHKVPVVTRGAGTGLSGGAIPSEQGILLVLTKLNQLLSCNLNNRTARVQPGVRNLAISEAVAKHGLFYAPDPSSQIACSIGGNVAENAGGAHCLKYGLTLHNVTGLELITATGESLWIDNQQEGPGLLSLIIGSEGLLGVVVEIEVKLSVIPKAVQVLLAAYKSVADASRAVATIIQSGITPAALEMMDGLAIRAAEAFAQAGYPLDAEAMLLLELDGSEPDVLAQTELVQKILLDCAAYHTQIAKNHQQQQLFWKGRKSAFPAVGRLFPDYYCMDGTIPRYQIGNVLEYITKRAEFYQLSVANVFHAGDGNLHPLILFDSNDEVQQENAHQLGADILEYCIGVGGCITGEHGVGLEKMDQMASQFSDSELEQFRLVKQAFDPDNILNPGKLFPSLKRCQEYRAIRHG